MNKYFYIIIACICFLQTSFSQEKIDYEAIHKIKKQAVQNSQIQKLSHELTDYIGPRLSGSTNLNRGRKWSMEKFNSWKLANVVEESYGEFGKGWDLEKSYVAMVEPYYQTLIATPKAWTKGTDGLVKSEVVLLKVDKAEDLEKYKGTLKGKIVTVKTSIEVTTKFESDAKRNTDEDLEKTFEFPLSSGGGRFSPADIERMRTQRDLSVKVNEFLETEGVALKISGTRGSFGTVFHSGSSAYRTGTPEAMTELEMSIEHQGRLVRLLESGKKVVLEAEIKAKFLDTDLKGYNVLAEIPGSDKTLKDELVLLGAHIDSWHAGTGGNDNAAGVVVMMEAIRILKEAGLQPKRTVRIALWGEEEQGLHGSRGYVKNRVKDNTAKKEMSEYSKISAYYNLDNGSGKIRGIYTQNNDMVNPIFKDWLKPFEEMGVTTISNRNTGSTDHVAFDAVGVPGFQFIQDPIDYGRGYHTNMDVYERMMLDDMKQAAIVIASLVYHTANRDLKLPRKP